MPAGNLSCGLNREGDKVERQAIIKAAQHLVLALAITTTG